MPCGEPRPTLHLTPRPPFHTPQAGADALFEDPDRRSTSLGVTVNPVRVPDIAGFGTLQVMPSYGAPRVPGEWHPKGSADARLIGGLHLHLPTFLCPLLARSTFLICV